MTLERFRELCLKQPGATEQIQWGADAVFKVGGKMFAVACTDAAYPNAKACSFKCDDEGFAELCEREGVVPAPYLARAKWVALDHWGALPDREIAARVTAAYAIVRGGLPKKLQATLGDTAAASRARLQTAKHTVRR
jgi:predicted DNA-binding protein (MmcQ/YjbR family)